MRAMQTTNNTGFFVMLDYERTAGYSDTLEGARFIGREIVENDPLPMNVSIFDESGNAVENLGFTHST